MDKVNINLITVGDRYRKDLGDIDALANSINVLGLLQPIGIDSNYALIFGERRLRACQQLGLDTIGARIIHVDNLAAEHDENEMRKSFTISERVAIAKARQDALGDRQGQRTDTLVVNSPQVEPGTKTRDIAAGEAGFKEKSYRDASKVVEAGDEEIVEMMDSEEVTVSFAAKLIDEDDDIKEEVIEAIHDGAKPAAALKAVKKKKKQAAKTKAVEDASVPLSADGLIMGDALLELKKLPDESVDLIVTDPPYNMDKADWDSYGSGEEYARWCEQWLEDCARVLKPHGAIYIFGINRMLSHLQRFLDERLVYRNWIVWDTIQGAGGGLWVNRHESILYYGKTSDTYENADAVKLERHEENVREYKGKTYEFKNPSNIWRFPAVDGSHSDRTAHLTQKPVELIQRIIKANSVSNAVVLDPFMGSGTTAVAAIREGRQWLGFEMDEDHYAIAARRITDETTD